MLPELSTPERLSLKNRPAHPPLLHRAVSRSITTFAFSTRKKHGRGARDEAIQAIGELDESNRVVCLVRTTRLPLVKPRRRNSRGSLNRVFRRAAVEIDCRDGRKERMELGSGWEGGGVELAKNAEGARID